MTKIANCLFDVVSSPLFFELGVNVNEAVNEASEALIWDARDADDMQVASILAQVHEKTRQLRHFYEPHWTNGH